MSWVGDHGDAITEAEAALATNRRPAELVVAVSAYYSSAGAALQQWKQQPWRVFLLLAGVRQGIAALRLANEVYRKSFALALKYPDVWVQLRPTLDQIDVLVTVWYRFGFGFYQKEAQELLYFAQRAVVKGDVAKHTQAFILMHRIRYGLEELNWITYHQLASLSEEVVKLARSYDQPQAGQAEFGQAARIMRQVAGLLPKQDSRREHHLRLAKEYAIEGGVTDQLLKLS